MKNPLLAAVCGVTLAMGTSLAGAQVAIRIGPPAPVYERPGPPPHPGWEFHHGYHRWDGAHYVWVPGEYVEPHPGHHWVDGHWAHRPGGYVWVEGHWR